MTTKCRFLTEAEAIAHVFSPDELAAWERLAPARDLAILLIRYRIDHDLSQRQLVRLLGVSQPFVAKLEAAEHMPTIDTLSQVAGLLGRELHVKVRPPIAAEAQEGPSVALSVAKRRSRTQDPPAREPD